MKKRIRVLLVDDHAPARGALRQLLEFEPDLEVVGEASNGQQALNSVELLWPDIVLMDINMPEGNGLETANQLQKDQGFTGKVIVLSIYEQFSRQAIESGVSAYIIKTAKPSEIVSVIRRVDGGELISSMIGSVSPAR